MEIRKLRSPLQQKWIIYGLGCSRPHPSGVFYMSAHILSQFGLEPMISSKVDTLALGVSTKTVVSWIETGILEGTKLGDRWLILLPSLKTVQQHARDKVWAST